MDSGPPLRSKPNHSDISLMELGPILEEYRQVKGFSDEQLWQRYHAFKEGKKLPEQIGPTSDESGTFGRYLQDLFKRRIDQRYPLKRLRNLLAAFDDPDTDSDMPWLMAEWLEAEVVDGPMLNLSLKFEDDDFRESSMQDLLHGCNATYHNAAQRLKEFECSFVTVKLEGNRTDIKTTQQLLSQSAKLLAGNAPQTLPPHTHAHVHPGDEFIYVRKGRIFAELDNSGVFQELNRGAYIHFTAEIPHALWNLSKQPAEVLVIRLFQLVKHGTRVEQREALYSIITDMELLDELYEMADKVPKGREPQRTEQGESPLRVAGRALREKWKKIEAWLHDRSRPPYDRLREGDQQTRRVLDAVGLMSFLKNYRNQSYPTADQSGETVWSPLQMSDDDLLRAFGEVDRARVKKFFKGTASSKEAVHDAQLLGTLAHSLNDIPPVLLEGYLAPAALRIAMVRGAELFKDEKPATEAMGFEYVRPLQPLREGAQYWIPARALANSDISLTLLDLSRDRLRAPANSQWNQHPGFEVVIPLKGTVDVEYRPITGHRGAETCGTGNILIYRSAWPHQVRLAEGCTFARVLVMRFNIVDEHAEKSFSAAAPTIEPSIKSDQEEIPSPDSVSDSKEAIPEESNYPLVIVEHSTRQIHVYDSPTSKPSFSIGLTGLPWRLICCLLDAGKSKHGTWKYVMTDDLAEKVWDQTKELSETIASTISSTRTQTNTKLGPVAKYISIDRAQDGRYRLICDCEIEQIRDRTDESQGAETTN